MELQSGRDGQGRRRLTKHEFVDKTISRSNHLRREKPPPSQKEKKKDANIIDAKLLYCCETNPKTKDKVKIRVNKEDIVTKIIKQFKP